MEYDHNSQAFYHLLQGILNFGEQVPSRNGKTLELMNVNFTIKNPQYKFYNLPYRNDNPIAKVAETLWVLFGSTDAKWLSWYLPRALDYSDDGVNWRAGYGGRLRHYGMTLDLDGKPILANSVDQLACIVDLLNKDLSTRRAVMSFFNPQLDYKNSKDIPCNNWLHFIVRNNTLHLNIAQRSCDIWYGFSGINSYEFSVLLEVVASMIGMSVGSITWFISSLHLYEQHFERARKLVDNYDQTNWFYDVVVPDKIRVNNVYDLDTQLRNIMHLANVFDTKDRISMSGTLNDHYWSNALSMLQIHNLLKHNKDLNFHSSSIQDIYNAMFDGDIKFIVKAYYERDKTI